MSTTRPLLDDLNRDVRSYAAKVAKGVDCQLKLAPDADAAPEHVAPCTCDHHTGVCRACGWIVTVGTDGTEYGHRRARYDPNVPVCPHRAPAVDPSGYATGGSD